MLRKRRRGTLVGRVVLIGLGVAGLAATAPATARAADDKSAPPAKSAPDERHHEGEYGGATPGVVYPYQEDKGDQKRFRRPAPRRKNTLYWIGFQSEADGRSRLFLKMTTDAEYTQTVTGKELVVFVAGVRPLARNTLRRLDVRFFDTSLLEVKSKRVRRRRAHKGQPARKAGIELHITFKNPADLHEATAQLHKEKDDFYYLYLDFGPATPLPEGEQETPPGGAGGN